MTDYQETINQMARWASRHRVDGGQIAVSPMEKCPLTGLWSAEISLLRDGSRTPFVSSQADSPANLLRAITARLSSMNRDQLCRRAQEYLDRKPVPAHLIDEIMHSYLQLNEPIVEKL